jgi:NIPSNAP
MTHFGHCRTRCSGLQYAGAKRRVVIGADHRGVDPGFSRTEVVAMIYELRVYQPVPGQMPKLLARFRDKLLPIWERHGIRPIGFWTTLVGEFPGRRAGPHPSMRKEVPADAVTPGLLLLSERLISSGTFT